MEPTQLRVGHYWKTNDAADLPFNEAGEERPTHILCFHMHDFLNNGETRKVPVEGLTLMAKAHFQKGHYSWTGESHRYGVYLLNEELNGRSWRRAIVVLEAHGAGMVGYCINNLTAIDTWKALVLLPEQMLWNVCHEMADARRTAVDATKSMYDHAIVEKRIKVMRRRGARWVHIEPRATPPAKVG